MITDHDESWSSHEDAYLLAVQHLAEDISSCAATLGLEHEPSYNCSFGLELLWDKVRISLEIFYHLFNLHSFQVICLQSGLVWDLQWEVLFTTQLKVFVILVSVLGSGSWYHNSWWSLQVISGTINLTSFGTSLHSCQVTGSQESVPAQTWIIWIVLISIWDGGLLPGSHKNLSPSW